MWIIHKLEKKKKKALWVRRSSLHIDKIHKMIIQIFMIQILLSKCYECCQKCQSFETAEGK